MKKNSLTQRVLLGSLLILVSIFFYTLHYAIFRDLHHIVLYLIGDIAFVFIQVLLVTLIIEHILGEREKQALIKKLNMVIGAFFSEVGTPLLKFFSKFDAEAENLSNQLIVDNSWSPGHFEQIQAILQNHDYKIESRSGDLQELQTFIVEKRAFLLRLLENPNLLEHEEFTELLWAVFHLMEELSFRKSVTNLPDTDFRHLSGDIKRAYGLLIREWLSHMEHLKDNYPYLFSLAIRTNPFDSSASVEVK
jgi:hypothetical protein